MSEGIFMEFFFDIQAIIKNMMKQIVKYIPIVAKICNAKIKIILLLNW